VHIRTYKELPLLCFSEQGLWHDWLMENHALISQVWLQFAKKGSGKKTITYEEARESALCFGWIDSTINRLDDDYYVMRFTIRQPKSVWSKINCEIVEALIASGKMQPAGLKHVVDAQADGRWDRAYDGASKMSVPEDFLAALEHNSAAAMNFDALDSSNRYAFLWRIQTSSPDTRAKKILRYVDMLENGVVFHPKDGSA